MRGVPAPAPRRRRTGTAAAAFSHVMALTGDFERSESIASEALDKGAGSRATALAHARHLAAEAAEDAPPLDNGIITESDLRDLAVRLSRTRPVGEQSFVDMESRYGFDNKMVAEIFGISPSRVSELSQEISTTWSETLDPAMVAWLGPGSCDQLATVLSDAPVAAGRGATETVSIVDGAAAPEIEALAGPTTRDLLSLGEAVLEHSHECVQCEQRLGTVTSVRSLIALAEPLPVPATVTRAARESRRKLPVALPPSFESRLRGKARPVLLGVAIAAALVALLAAGGLSFVGGDPSQSERVDRLVESAPEGTLTSKPSFLAPGTSSVSVANNGSTPVTWQATSSVPWLNAEPSQGVLDPNQATDVRVTFTTPESERTDGATLTISGSDGNRRVLRYDSER